LNVSPIAPCSNRPGTIPLVDNICTIYFLALFGFARLLREILNLAEHKVNHDIARALGSALLAASFAGDAQPVQTLLDATADVDSCDLRGVTALSFAARENHWDVVNLLLQANANVQLGCKLGYLHSSAIVNQQIMQP
jgi:ankyrin repeat protein